jgi:hypothetical protein
MILHLINRRRVKQCVKNRRGFIQLRMDGFPFKRFII